MVPEPSQKRRVCRSSDTMAENAGRVVMGGQVGGNSPSSLRV